jgi:hypothetical protein
MAVPANFLDGTTWKVMKGAVEFHMKTVTASMEAKEIDHTGSKYDPAFTISAGGKQSMTMTMEGPLEVGATPPAFALREVATFTYTPDAALVGITFLGVILSSEIADSDEGPRLTLTVKNRGEFIPDFGPPA